MTHIPEREFQRRAEAWLTNEYGEENVHRNVYLPQSYRFADFIVHGPLATWAIEAENDSESIIKGAGQAILYAAHGDYSPAVIVPKDHTESPEVEMIRERITVKELDV